MWPVARLILMGLVAVVLSVDVALRYYRATKERVETVASWSKVLPIPVVALLSAISIEFVGFIAVALLTVSALVSLDSFKFDAVGIGEDKAHRFEAFFRLWGGLGVLLFFSSELFVGALMLGGAIYGALQMITQ